MRMSIFFAAYFCVVGVYLPFFPVWLAARGLTPDQIGIIVAAPMIVRVLFTPALAVAAGRFASISLAAAILAALGAAPMMLLSLAPGFIAILLVITLSALFWNPVLPLAEALAMAGVRRGSASYGRMRMWGSWSFIVANFGGGWLLTRLRPDDTVLLIAAAYGTAAVAAAFLREPRRRPDDRLPGEGAGLRDALAILSIRPLSLGIIAAALLQSSHAVFYAFGSIHWASAGIGLETIGGLWAIGVLAEIGVFAASSRMARAFGPFAMLALAAAAGIIRWAAFSADPGLAALVLLQTLHGFTFGAAHVGIVRLVSAALPERQAAAGQAFYFTTGGVAQGLSLLAAGSLYAAFAGGAYLAMAGISLAGGLIAIVGMMAYGSGPDEAGHERRTPT